MKKLFSILFVLVFCFFAFSGCSYTKDKLNLGKNDKPDAPPDLIVKYEEQTIKAWRGTYAWEINGNFIMSDSVGPLDIKDRLPWLQLSNETKLTFDFEFKPTSIKVERCSIDAIDYNDLIEIPITKSSIKIDKGGYIYFITASWNDETKNYNGTADYAFIIK